MARGVVSGRMAQGLASAALAGWIGIATAGPAVGAGAVERDPPGPVDAQLQQLVQAALRTHPSALQGGSQIEAAQWTLQGARRASWPTPSISTSLANGVRSVDVRLTRHLFDWGRVASGIASATNRVAAAEAAAGALQQGVAGQVIAAWRDWALARRRELAYAAAAERLTGYERGALARHEAGVGGDADLALVRTRTVQLQAERQANATVASTAFDRLRVLGADMSAATALVSASDRGLPTWDRAQALQVAASRSPHLAQLDAEILALQDEADAQQAQARPTVNLAAVHQRSAGGVQAESTRLLLSLDYSLASGLAAGDAAAGTRARARALGAEREIAATDLRTAVAQEHANLASLLARLPDDRASARASLAVLESYERQFVAGRKSWQEVLNAARESMLGDVQLHTTQIDLLASHARLQVWMGTFNRTGDASGH